MIKTIAFPRETHKDETRTVIVPRDVNTYIQAGFEVLVEEGIGTGPGINDSEYLDAGARVLRRDNVWASPFVVKYKAPQQEEFIYFHSGLTLATSFHPEGDPAMVKALCDGSVTAYSLEYCTTPDNIIPIPTSDMEITGKLAFMQGAYLLQTQFGGSGVLLAHIPGADAPKVLVIGHGKVGGAAARTAAAFGCKVTVLGRDRTHLRMFQATVGPGITCRLNSKEAIEDEIRDADLVIGAILIATEETPAMIERRHLATMKKGSLIMDLTCGYGDGVGWMPTFHRTTSVEFPVYAVDGILHYKMDRIPSRVPRTASQARSYNAAPYLVELGDVVYQRRAHAFFDTGKITENGKIVHQYLSDSFAHYDKMRPYLINSRPHSLTDSAPSALN